MQLNKLNFFDRITHYTENGLYSKGFDCVDQVARESCRRAKVKMIETVEEFIDEQSGFSDLVLENFRFIFTYYFVLCSLVFIAFLIHHLIKFVNKSIPDVRSLMRRCFNRFWSWRFSC